MLPCNTIESCIHFRRIPTENEEKGYWAEDPCMNCKTGKERELALARQREESPDESCIFCYEPLNPITRVRPNHNRKYPVCKICYGERLSNIALRNGKTRWGFDKEPETVEEAVEIARRI